MAGVSPLFPPRYAESQAAKEALLGVIHRDPRQFGIEGSRWTLAAIHAVCGWLRVSTPAGLSALLDRLGISWKRAREHIFSPDPDYLGKVEYAQQLVRAAWAQPGRVITLYQDELTFYRQPSLAQAWEAKGSAQALAQRSYRANTLSRLVGTIDVTDGRVVYWRGSKTGLSELVDFYQRVSLVYPGAQRIWVLLDNWPVHFHVDVLAALEPQENPWPVHRLATWPQQPSQKAIERYGRLRLPIQLVPLPTYAPWTNPMEKVWRKLKQEVLHLHRLADRLDDLRLQVDQFLEGFANGSDDLLRYVGLLHPI